MSGKGGEVDTIRYNIRTIANYHGYDSQSRQLIEEMGELIQALNKFWRKQQKCGSRAFEDVPLGSLEELHIAEEIADVEICLEQVKMLLYCHEEVNDFKRQKVERVLKRIETEESACL